MWIDLAAVCRFFFFQAEDGIRDLTVTGVQTCALPIWAHSRAARSVTRLRRTAARAEPTGETAMTTRSKPRAARSVAARTKRASSSGLKIGRASCRERG